MAPEAHLERDPTGDDAGTGPHADRGGRETTARLRTDPAITSDQDPVVQPRPDPGPAGSTLPDAVLDRVRLVEAVVDGVTICDRDWRYRYLSPGAERLIGRPAAELLGHRVWDLAPEHRDGPVHEACRRAVRDGAPVDLTWYNSRRQAWFEQRIVPLDPFVLIATRDVTSREVGRRRGEQLLHVSEALARAVGPEEVAEVVTGLLVVDPAVRAVALVTTEGARTASVLASSGFGRADLALLTDRVRDRQVALRAVPASAAVEQEAGTAWLPLRAGTSSLGVLVVAHAEGLAFDGEQAEYLRSAAASASQALSRTLRSAAEHRAAVALQRSLLPEVDGRIGRLSLAARYLPGDPGVEVGGDWFDAVPVAEGLFLVVGDVQGHDVEAAAIMGQLRSVVRAYAAEGLPPAGILRRAHQYLEGLGAERIVTVLIVYLHGGGEVATLACAGHPVPLLLAAVDGRWTCRELGAVTGPPLGVPRAGWREVTVLVPPEVTLLLYTDGLVETAAWGGGERGTRELVGALERLDPRSSLDDVLAAALAVIPAGLRGDDVAVLAARVPPTADPGGRSAERTFSAHAMSVPLTRSWLRGLLDGWGLAGLGETAELVLSELVSNAVRHTEDPVAVRVGADRDTLTLEVFDSSHRLPVPREAGPDDPGGRGLAVTAALAGWGVEERDDGKVVWARIPIPPDPLGDAAPDPGGPDVR